MRARKVRVVRMGWLQSLQVCQVRVKGRMEDIGGGFASRDAHATLTVRGVNALHEASGEHVLERRRIQELEGPAIQLLGVCVT